MKRGMTIGLPAALVLAGIVVLAGALAAHRTASRADDWLQARATIERVDGRNVSYRYEAGGRAQRGTSATDQRHAAGASVLVYVNPDDPAESMLELPRRPSLWPAFAGALLLFAGLTVGAYFFLQERKKPQQAKGAAPRNGPTPRNGATPPRNGATPARKVAAPPLSRLRPPPSVKRTAPDTPEP